MAWNFDGSSHVTVASSPAITLPNSGWGILGWFRVSSNSGSGFPRLLEMNTTGSGNNRFVIFLAQSETGVINSDTVGARVVDSSGSETGIIFNDSFKVSEHLNKWVAVLFTHEESSDTTYLRVLDTDAGLVYTDSSVSALGLVDPDEDLFFGSRPDLNEDRFLTGDLAEWVFVNRFIDLSEFVAWTRGTPGYKVTGNYLYLPMTEGIYSELSNQRDITNNGSTGSESHPRVSLFTPRWTTSGQLGINDFSIDRALESPVSLTQSSQVQFAIVEATASSALSFDQLLETQFKSRTVSSTINLSQNNATSRPKSVEAEQESLSFSHIADSSILTRTVQNNLNLSQQSDVGGEKTSAANNSISFSQAAKSNILTRTAQSEIEFIHFTGDGFVSVEAIVLSADNTISFDQTINREFVKASGTDLTASDTLSLSHRSFIPVVLEANSTITFSQEASADKILEASSFISLSHWVVLNRPLSLTASNDLNLSQAFTYQIIRGGIPVVPSGGCPIKWQYYPLLSTGSDVKSMAPMLSKKEDVQLFYPFGAINQATDSVTLRTPNFNNRDRNQYSRINRESRGGSLSIFRDPDWPQQRILVMDFSGVKDSEKDAILEFLEDTLGQRIGFRDWLGRVWRGIVTNPDTPIIQNRRNNSDISIELEVEDFTLEPQASSELSLQHTSEIEVESGIKYVLIR